MNSKQRLEFRIVVSKRDVHTVAHEDIWVAHSMHKLLCKLMLDDSRYLYRWWKCARTPLREYDELS